MLILKNHNEAITNPSQLKGFSFKELEDIRQLENKTALIFVMPELSKLKSLPGAINKQKSIYKTGFLNEVYEILYPDMPRHKAFETITCKYDIFINNRQFQRNVQDYNSKKTSIFVEPCF